MCRSKNHRRQDYHWHQNMVNQVIKPSAPRESNYRKRIKARRRAEFMRDVVRPLFYYTIALVGVVWLAVRTF